MEGSKSDRGAVFSLSLDHAALALNCASFDDDSGDVKVVAVTTTGVAYVWQASTLGLSRKQSASTMAFWSYSEQQTDFSTRTTNRYSPKNKPMHLDVFAGEHLTQQFSLLSLDFLKRPKRSVSVSGGEEHYYTKCHVLHHTLPPFSYSNGRRKDQ